ncbi:MAG TPA: DUF4065 domain-containing protein [Candidatus Pelethosoma merdigallinarum]|nr:DUF4065 domain-containing protein [Candidatus Pelethosoma merdigallinarum]
MEKKLYCFNCDKDVKPLCTIQNNTYVVRHQEVHVEEQVFKCPVCENELINDNLNDSLYNIYNAYLELYGLSFEKLKEIRNSYNLSQELFAKALGWSKRTIIRYEHAESLPRKQYLLIYKNIKNNKNAFLEILKSNKDSMDKKDYYRICHLINAELDLKTINVFLYVLKNNALYRTQIMKNFFAIDFESVKETNHSITSFKYAHGTYGPVIDNQGTYLQLLVHQNYLNFSNDEDDKILFTPNQDCDLSLFTKEEIIIMDKVLSQLENKSASQLTEWSHKFKGWIETKDGEIIDYSYAKDFELKNNW